MAASGSGAPGTVNADVVFRLAPSPDGGTEIGYDADAAVGGAIGGVGQRMLSGVTRKMAGQFFTAVDQEIAGVGAAPAPAAGPVAAGAPAGAAVGTPGATEPSGIRPAAGGAGTVYAGRAAASAESTRIKDFVMGTVTGGTIALIGVVVGWAVGRG
jgi:hypothetical protein